MAKQQNKEEGAVDEDHDLAKDENEVVDREEEEEENDSNEGVIIGGPPVSFQVG